MLSFRVFVQVARSLFEPYIVTAANESHAIKFVEAFAALESNNEFKHVRFYKRIGERGRLFCDCGSGEQKKDLNTTTRTSIFSTIIIDDCHNRYAAATVLVPLHL